MAIDKLFGGIFRGKRVLITGDTGFKGSWLATWLLEMGAEVYGYALPPKTGEDNFVSSGLQQKVTHVDGDVTDFTSFNSFVNRVQPEFAFHLAAQALVLNSYQNPQETFQTNVMGTVNFFETVRKNKQIKVAINVTSDKCYDNKEWVWGYRESDAMGGKDPYSASKGCSELITNAYTHSYFQPQEGNASVASARAGNVIGGGDWAENRIVPDFFRAIKAKIPLTIRNPAFTRPWQHVLEPLSGYLHLASKMSGHGTMYSGGWNFGPAESGNYSVQSLVDRIIKEHGKGSYKIPENLQKPHEANLLKLDISKAMKFLHWKPVLNFEETVAFTVSGYQADIASKNIYQARVDQIKLYADTARTRDIEWAVSKN